MKNEEKINLREILKNCPKGTKLYSPLIGDVELNEVFEEYGSKDKDAVSVIFTNIDGTKNVIYFTENGHFFNSLDAECLLFPSKDCRDWSQFKAPKPEYEFKPFEKVLVRNFNEDKWKAAFFEEKIEGNSPYYLIGILKPFRYCIQYKGNEHLHNTINKPK